MAIDFPLKIVIFHSYVKLTEGIIPDETNCCMADLRWWQMSDGLSEFVVRGDVG